MLGWAEGLVFMPARAREKIPRNAPCPCGSGRKYKRCCMRAPTPGRGHARLDPRDLTTRLLDHVERVEPEHLDRVCTELFGDELPRRHERIATPMALFELPLSSGRTAAEDLPARGLPAEQRRELAARRAARLSIWEVLELRPGRRFEAIDLLTGERALIHDNRFHAQLRLRGVLLARVFELHGRRRLDGVHPESLGPRAADEVVEQILARVDRRRRRLEHEQLRTPEVALALFHAWHDRVRVAMNEEAVLSEVELRNTDGDDYEPTTDLYEIRSGSTAELEQLLLGLPDVFEFEDEDPHLCFTRKGNAMHRDWVRTTLARAYLDGDRLRVETNSPRRADGTRSSSASPASACATSNAMSRRSRAG